MSKLLYGELRAARRLGLADEADIYEACFPDLAESLRRQFEVLEWLRVIADEIESESDPAE